MEVGPRRLFFALPLPPELREALDRWRRTQPPAPWVRPEGLHLTLAFLGERPAEDLPALVGLGAAVAARHAALALGTAGLGGFPDGARTRVLWLGLAPSAPLAALSADLRGALAATGGAFDAKPFLPHLTLARFHHLGAVGAFTAPAPASFSAECLVLVESRPRGEYAPVGAWSFREV